MTTERLQRIHELFEKASTYPPGQREAVIAESCGDDDELRSEVVSLLEHDELAPADFMQPPTRPEIIPDILDSPDPLLEKLIGKYRIKRVIATGGMGTVYEAEQDNPKRSVALKMLRAGVTSRYALRHLEYESKILARLRHANIAQVYEAGAFKNPAAGGQALPYFAMEFVPDALEITHYADERRLGTRDRLKLFSQVLDAVCHGHQNGIIHRDLKPGNILVDAEGQVKVIDFGVARSTDSDIAATTMRTDVGQLVGTLQYMSPEQCEGNTANIDFRSDVYSLGVVLYELLAGRLPYDAPSSIIEAARVVREDAPTRLTKINPRLGGDLETIVFKCLQKQPSQRYQSVTELIADIRRHLDHKPILARRPSVWRHAMLFARRNRLATAIGTVFVLSMIGFLISLSITVRKLTWETYLSNIRLADAKLVQHSVKSAVDAVEAAPEDHRNWEWGYLNAQSDHSLRSLVLEDTQGFRLLLARPESQLVVGVERPSTYRVWSLKSGKVLGEFHHGLDSQAIVTVSSDGRWLTLGDRQGKAEIWKLANRERIAAFELDEAPVITALELSADGALLAIGSGESALQVWDVKAGEFVFAAQQHGQLARLVFSHEANLLVASLSDGTIRVYDLSSGEVVYEPPHAPRGSYYSTITADGSLLATASFEENQIWDVASHKLVRSLPDVSDPPPSAFFSLDGSYFLARHHSYIRIWDMSSGTVGNLHGRANWFGEVDFLPGSREFIAPASDGTVNTWSTTPPEKLYQLRGHQLGVRSVVFSPDGMKLASSAYDSTVRVWDCTSGEELAVFEGHNGPVVTVAFSPDGSVLASASEDHTIRLWDANTGKRRQTIAGHTDQVISISFSPDGRTLASTSMDKTARLWDITSCKETLKIPLSHRGKAVAFHPNGKTILTGSYGKTLRVWETASGSQLAELNIGFGFAEGMAVSSDGTFFISVGGDATAHVIDAVDFSVRQTLALPASISSVAISPDGNRAVFGLNDKTVGVFNVPHGTHLISLCGHAREVASVAFSPDGERVASGDAGGEIRIWDSIPFRKRLKEYEALQAARPEAEKLVARLLVDLPTPEAVAEHLRENDLLPPTLRHAALNELLRRAGSE